MSRVTVTAGVLVLSAVVLVGQTRPPTPAAALDGTWQLNRELSQFPRDVGFGMDVTGAGKPASGDTGAAEMVGQGSNPGLAVNRPASREEAMNSRQLVAEVRTPPLRLTIARSGGTLVITDERGRSRTYHPDGREAFTPFDAAPVATVSRWEAGRLVVRYKVEPGREVR